MLQRCARQRLVQNMAVLGRDEILKRIRQGIIKIEPFAEEQVGPASVDLHIDRKFRVFRSQPHVHHVNEEANFQDVTELIEIEDHFLLRPGETVLAITRERVTLPDNLCGWLQGRSRFARLGLMVHITAAFVQPGIDNKQVLEMNNAGPVTLAIHPGIAICQLIVEEMHGHGRYVGRFAIQEAP